MIQWFVLETHLSTLLTRWESVQLKIDIRDLFHFSLMMMVESDGNLLVYVFSLLNRFNLSQLTAIIFIPQPNTMFAHWFTHIFMSNLD